MRDEHSIPRVAYPFLLQRGASHVAHRRRLYLYRLRPCWHEYLRRGPQPQGGAAGLWAVLVVYRPSSSFVWASRTKGNDGPETRVPTQPTAARWMSAARKRKALRLSTAAERSSQEYMPLPLCAYSPYLRTRMVHINMWEAWYDFKGPRLGKHDNMRQSWLYNANL